MFLPKPEQLSTVFLITIVTCFPLVALMATLVALMATLVVLKNLLGLLI